MAAVDTIRAVQALSASISTCHLGRTTAERWQPKVVVDGLNVARHKAPDQGSASNRMRPADDLVAGGANGNVAAPRGSARPLAEAISSLLSRGYEVHVFLPEWACDGGPKTLNQVEVLQPFEGRFHLHRSPAGSDDDQFILDYAQSKNAFVLSNDQFRDHIDKGLVSRRWVDEHRWAFMFVDEELFVTDGAARARNRA